MLYIISGDVTDKEVEPKAKSVAKIIEDAGGKIKDSDIGERKSLVYKIQKQNTGIYVNLIFELDPEKLDKIKKELKVPSFLLRYLISRVPKRKPVIRLKPRAAVPKPEVEQEKVPVVTEAMKAEPVKKPEVEVEPFDKAQDKKVEKKVRQPTEKKAVEKKEEPKKPVVKEEKPLDKAPASAKAMADKQDRKVKAKLAPFKPKKKEEKTEITRDIESEEERLKKLDKKLKEILED